MKIYLHTHKLIVLGEEIMQAGIGVSQTGEDVDNMGVIFLPDGIKSEENLFHNAVSLFGMACDMAVLLEGLGFPTERAVCLTGIYALRDALKKALEA